MSPWRPGGELAARPRRPPGARPGYSERNPLDRNSNYRGWLPLDGAVAKIGEAAAGAAAPARTLWNWTFTASGRAETPSFSTLRRSPPTKTYDSSGHQRITSIKSTASATGPAPQQPALPGKTLPKVLPQARCRGKYPQSREPSPARTNSHTSPQGAGRHGRAASRHDGQDRWMPPFFERPRWGAITRGRKL